MQIRNATPADLPDLRAMERNAEMAAHWSQAEYARLTGRGSCHHLVLVADDGAVRGFLAARTAGPEWEVENVVVDAASRRQGIGSALIRRLLAQAARDRADAVWLEVRESNIAARALYAGCGFRESGRRKKYYSDPAEDAILYKFVVG